NTADNDPAPRLLDEVPLDARFVLGDTHYNDPAVRDHCFGAGRLLVATRRGAYPHTDDGVEVRRVFHKLRSLAIENFNGQFKGIFDAHGRSPRAASTGPAASPSAPSSSTNSPCS